MKVIFKILLMILATIGIVVTSIPVLGAGKDTQTQTVKMCLCGLNHDRKPAEITAEKAERNLSFARGTFWTTVGIFALGLAIKTQTKILDPYNFRNADLNRANLAPALNMMTAGIFGTAITGINLAKKEQSAAASIPDKASGFHKKLGEVIGGIATVGSVILLGSAAFFGRFFIE